MKHMRDLLLLAPDGDGGGPATLEQVAEKVLTIAANQKSLHETVNSTLLPLPEAIEALKADSEALTARMDAETAAIKAALKESHGGVSGAEDWLNMVGKAMIGLAQKKRHGSVDSTIMFKGDVNLAQMVQKAAATFDTTTNATAAYLLPEILMPGFIELGDIYGNLWPLLTKFTAPMGQKVHISPQVARPVARYRTTQGGAMTEEDTPMAFGRNTITTELVYVYLTIANEMLNATGIGFAAIATAESLRAINRLNEYSVLAGTDSGGAPSDGVIAVATDQGTMASATFGNVINFLQDCMDDNEVAADPMRSVLLMTPRDGLTLAAQAVGTSELTGMLVWGNPRQGIPTTLMGYPVVTHPACYNGTSRHMLLGDPRKIFVGEDASYGVDFSEHVKFGDYETALRIINHVDWVIPQTTEWHKVVVTG